MRCPALDELPRPPSGKTGWPWTEASPQLPATMPDGAPWPRVSVVTPSYNQGDFIEETTRSVLLQGYPNLEYFIIDGGSTDGSVEIIKKYERWLTYWVSEEDKGQSDAIQKGFARATGEILGWLNSDDLLRPDALNCVGAYFAEYSECQFLTGDGMFVDASGTRLEYLKQAQPYSYFDLLKFHEGNYLPQPSVFFTHCAFDQVGGLDLSLHYAMDIDLWIRLRALYELHYVPKTLGVMRRHPRAKTWQGNEAGLLEVRQVIQQYLYRLPLLERIRIRIGFRLFLAKSACQYGLMNYFADNHRAALGSLGRAVRHHPLVVLSPTALRLALRLFLPLGVKKRLFHAP